MFTNWNHNRYIHIKNFVKEKEFFKIKKDLINNFKYYPHPDKLKSGRQTTNNLYEVFCHKKHWQNYFSKLAEIMTDLGKERLSKCWSLKINKHEKHFLHRHPENNYTSVFYLSNENYELGTRLIDNNNEIIIPGYENSMLIFEGKILHDAVFPKYKLKKPRYTLITDYE
tara:strand:- start:537 stop:1043 length:507 start_codon:yes stop_codon:yes gene_type:complete